MHSREISLSNTVKIFIVQCISTFPWTSSIHSISCLSTNTYLMNNWRRWCQETVLCLCELTSWFSFLKWKQRNPWAHEAGNFRCRFPNISSSINQVQIMINEIGSLLWALSAINEDIFDILLSSAKRCFLKTRDYVGTQNNWKQCQILKSRTNQLTYTFRSLSPSRSYRFI